MQGTVLVFRDVTERRRAESALRASTRALQRSNDDLERFAFVASHDLQEPLRMIATYSQLLIKSYPGQFDDDSRIFVANIVDGTKRMRELLADLLAYTEIRAQPDEPVEAVDLNLIIGQVIQNLKASIDETGAIVTSGWLPTLSAHAAHFTSLFQNLIGNAIKYRSGQPPRVHVSVEDTGASCSLPWPTTASASIRNTTSKSLRCSRGCMAGRSRAPAWALPFASAWWNGTAGGSGFSRRLDRERRSFLHCLASRSMRRVRIE